MKITKFVHSCILIESDGHAALFDPGGMSEAALDDASVQALDDIFITHEHGDHVSLPLVKQLVTKFPNVRITSTPTVVKQLAVEHMTASSAPPTEATLFDSPHEGHLPFMQPPEQYGIHYLNLFSHPGDSHSFAETKAVLALPVTAPWGSTINAVDLAFKLKPKYIIPIHDWFWHDQARKMLYDRLEQLFKTGDMTFLKPETGEPINIEVE